MCPAGGIVDGEFAVDERQEPAQAILQVPAHLAVVALRLHAPDVILQSFPLPQRTHQQPNELPFFVTPETPLQAQPFYLPEVVP